VHGLQAEGARVQETLRQAMKIRRRLYAPRPGAAPGPKEGGVFSLTELEKFQPDPPWYGSQVLGDVVGGAVQQPIKEAD
jgi:hypothetical protein